MIFTVETSPLTGEICIIPSDNYAWDLFDMLKAAESDNIRIGCFGGYENCVIFEKN